MRNFAIILPAAGASSRMRGGDKLLETVDGVACLRTMAKRAVETGARVFVILPAPDDPRVAVLDGLDVTPIWVPDANLGMSQSLKRGIASLPCGITAAMILPPDMPLIETPDMLAVLNAMAAGGALICQATTESGVPGHPTSFHHSLFGEFATLTGDVGAREIVKRHAAHVKKVPLPGNRARVDLDTPEDWAGWRTARSAP